MNHINELRKSFPGLIFEKGEREGNRTPYEVWKDEIEEFLGILVWDNRLKKWAASQGSYCPGDDSTYTFDSPKIAMKEVLK